MSTRDRRAPGSDVVGAVFGRRWLLAIAHRQAPRGGHEEPDPGPAARTTLRLLARHEEPMRYMMMIKGNADYEAGLPAPQKVMDGMRALTEEMMGTGVLVDSAGLLPSSQGGMRIHLTNGKRSVIDGPFAEAKEVVGGYAIVEARSKYEALALAQRVMDIHADAGIRNLEMEIRPLGMCAQVAAQAAA